MPRLRNFLVTLNLGVSFIIWLPAWVKMLRTESSHDYALPSFFLILFLQASNLFIATTDKSRRLMLYFGVNFLLVAWTMGLIWWYQR